VLQCALQRVLQCVLQYMLRSGFTAQAFVRECSDSQEVCVLWCVLQCVLQRVLQRVLQCGFIM